MSHAGSAVLATAADRLGLTRALSLLRSLRCERPQTVTRDAWPGRWLSLKVAAGDG